LSFTSQPLRKSSQQAPGAIFTPQFGDFADFFHFRTLETALHRPHVRGLTPTENLRAASSEHIAAIARWDDDGGAPRSAASDVEAARNERSRPSAN
jgi:hypothetical protein